VRGNVLGGSSRNHLGATGHCSALQTLDPPCPTAFADPAPFRPPFLLLPAPALPPPRTPGSKTQQGWRSGEKESSRTGVPTRLTRPNAARLPGSWRARSLQAARIPVTIGSTSSLVERVSFEHERGGGLREGGSVATPFFRTKVLAISL